MEQIQLITNWKPANCKPIKPFVFLTQLPCTLYFSNGKLTSTHKQPTFQFQQHRYTSLPTFQKKRNHTMRAFLRFSFFYSAWHFGRSSILSQQYFIFRCWIIIHSMTFTKVHLHSFLLARLWVAFTLRLGKNQTSTPSFRGHHCSFSGIHHGFLESSFFNNAIIKRKWSFLNTSLLDITMAVTPQCLKGS